MTYQAFLLEFVLPAVGILLVFTFLDLFRKRKIPQTLRSYPAGGIIPLVAVGVAAYVSLFANILAFAGVRVYLTKTDANLGPSGYLPLEEYGFVLSQALLAGLWLFWVSKRLPMPIRPPPLVEQLRWQIALPVGGLWPASVVMLLVGWLPGMYLGLILAGLLPGIIALLAFGADILWRYWLLVTVGILAPTGYLLFVNAIAVTSGLWRVSPEKSANLLPTDVFAVEDLVLFLLVCTLTVFGTVLCAAEESQPRLPPLLRTGRTA